MSLGLPIDISVAEDFQDTTRHLNYLYGKAIDGIYEFFRFDSNINNTISKPVFTILNKTIVLLFEDVASLAIPETIFGCF